MLLESIKKCGAEMHAKLYDNVVLSGGTMQCEGMGERLKAELQKSVPPRILQNNGLNVLQPDHAKWCVWHGGRNNVTATRFASDWYTRAMWDEDKHDPAKACMKFY